MLYLKCTLKFVGRNSLFLRQCSVTDVEILTAVDMKGNYIVGCYGLQSDTSSGTFQSSVLSPSSCNLLFPLLLAIFSGFLFRPISEPNFPPEARSAFYKLPAYCLNASLFGPEDGGSCTFPRNVGEFLPDHTASHPEYGTLQRNSFLYSITCSLKSLEIVLSKKLIAV